MGKRKISVAMATFNGEQYIEKQLNTILHQTVKPDEVIIYDDKSTDRTVKIIKEFIDRHNLFTWYLFVNSSNEGFRRNFYNAIKKTTGDVIFLADQDDEWCDNKFSQMLGVLKQNANICALSCAVKLIDGDSLELDYKCQPRYYNCDFLYLEHEPSETEMFGLEYIAKHNISPGCTTAITRPLADLFLSKYNFELPHDWFLNLLAAANNGCAFINKPLIKYRRHSNNTIGVNNGVISGIRKKTRTIRIEEYSSRIRAIQIACDCVNDVNDSKNIKLIIELYKQMLNFYSAPSIEKLVRIRRNKEYYELAKSKVRIWEFFVALKLDTVIGKLVE